MKMFLVWVGFGLLITLIDLVKADVSIPLVMGFWLLMAIPVLTRIIISIKKDANEVKDEM